MAKHNRTQYIDDMGKLVKVSSGISGDKWWAAFRVKKSGALQRIKSKYLPERDSPLAAQADLHHYAQKMGWPIYNPGEMASD